MIEHLAAWLMTYALHSTIVLLLAVVAIRLIPSAAIRDALCRIALISALLTATVQQFLPERPRLELGTIEVERIAQPLPSTAIDAAHRLAADAHQSAAEPVAQPIQQRLRTSWRIAILAIWGSVASLLIGRLLVRRRQLLRSFGVRNEAVDAADLILLNLLRDRAGMRAPVRLTTSDTLSSPLAMQTSEICVPRQMFAALTLDQKEAILAHELAHLIRRDPLWLMLSEGLKALFFFQPLTRVLQKRMRETAEFLCDDFALLHTGKPKALAETLADLASRLQQETHLLPVAAMAESKSRLIERVTRVLHPGRAPETTLSFAAAAVIAIAIVVAGAAFAPGVSARVIVAPDGSEYLVTRRPSKPVAMTSNATPFRLAKSQPPEERSQTRGTDRSSAPLEIELDADSVSLSQHDDLSRTTLSARHVRMNRDASHIEFTKRSGSLDVVQERTGGERHVLKVRPARGGVAYSHTVDGVLRPWDAESRAILLDAFRRRSHLMEQTAKYRTDPPPPTAGGERWSGIQEITGTSNGIPFRFTVSGKNMSFTGNRVTFIHPGGSLRIDEEVESRSRSAVITGSGADFEIRYSGDWDGASEEERAAWLEHYLRARSGQHGSLFRWKE